MRSDPRQSVIPYPDVAADKARLFRIQAETWRAQYPNDERQYRYYINEAERLEAQTR